MPDLDKTTSFYVKINCLIPAQPALLALIDSMLRFCTLPGTAVLPTKLNTPVI
jgi:hypothetical protein